MNRGALKEELQLAIEDAVMGANFDRWLTGKVELAVTTILQRRGLRGARVSVRTKGHGLIVEIQLPPAQARVERIVIQVG